MNQAHFTPFMHVKYFLSLFFLLTLTTASYASEVISPYHCKELKPICIEINFETFVDENADKLSKGYEFPYYTRQGDLLSIKHILFVNNDNKTYAAFDYSIQILPFDYKSFDEDLKKAFPEDYSTWSVHVPELGPGETYSIEYRGDRKWVTHKNEKEVGSQNFIRVALYKEGEWVIKEDAIEQKMRREFNSYRSVIEGNWRGSIFQVNSPFEITTLVDAKKSLSVANVALVVSIITLVLLIREHSHYCRKKNKDKHL